MSYWVEVLLSKYRYAQPSNRHLQDLQDQGLPVSPGTLAGGLHAIAPLLFGGPTGVDKTAAAKALAEYFFASGQTRTPLLRIDMSELQHPAHIGRLIGYDGDTPGKLIQHVRYTPFSVILLDEIEKVHDCIFDTQLWSFPAWPISC